MYDLVAYDCWSKDDRWLPCGSPFWRGELSLEQLTARMTRFDVVETKGRAKCWSPVRLRPMESGQYRRRNSLVDFISCLVVDLDEGGIDREGLRSALGEVHAIYPSTYSSTSEHPKGRAIMPLEKPCPAALWPRMWQWVEERLGAVVDRACKDPARVFYVPSHPPIGHCESWVQRAPVLAVDYMALPMTPLERKIEARKQRQRDPVVFDSRDLCKLLRDPRYRLKAAEDLGARIMGDRATSIPCPGCGRNDVWFLIQHPGKARCNHVNTCGGSYWLDQLLERV